MKLAPYSLQDAENICTEFQYLAGQPFDKESGITIDCIAITPFDQQSKKRFVAFYLLLGDAKEALAHDYKGLLFDVMVMGCGKDGTFVHKDIYTWLFDNKGVGETRTRLLANSTAAYL